MEQENKGEKVKLEQLTSDQIRTGMLVVCFKKPALIYVGRVHSDVTRYLLLQALFSGVFAEFDLLYADQHLHAGDLVWNKYFYRNPEAPTASGVFKWPELTTLTFISAESRLKMNYIGWLVHIEVRYPQISPPIVLE
jgi:hypothetical protein